MRIALRGFREISTVPLQILSWSSAQSSCVVERRPPTVSSTRRARQRKKSETGSGLLRQQTHSPCLSPFFLAQARSVPPSQRTEQALTRSYASTQRSKRSSLLSRADQENKGAEAACTALLHFFLLSRMQMQQATAGPHAA
jgi:hypothetical protein